MENRTKLFIGMLNDKLHGRYPMTLDCLRKEIEKVPAGLMLSEPAGNNIIPLKESLRLGLHLIPTDSNSFYEFFVREVKPIIYPDLQ